MEHEMNCSRYFLAMRRAASLAGVASIFVVFAWGANAQGNDDRSGKSNVRSETLRIRNTIHPIIVGRNYHRHDDHKQRYPFTDPRTLAAATSACRWQRFVN
jgi:hypothetical protein